MPSSRLLTALCVVAIGTPSVSYAAPVYHALSHASLAGHLPGADGLVGTHDDVISPGANPSGAVSFTRFSETPFSPTADFFSFTEGTLTITQPLVVDGDAVIRAERFELELFARATTGFDSTVFDLPVGHHEIVTTLPFVQSTRMTQGICFVFTGCAPGQAAPDVEFDVTGYGFTVSPGYDASRFPGVDPTLAAYLESLTPLAPTGWTALAIGVGEASLTATNTRGPFADYFVGGASAGVSVFVTADTLVLVPEPSSLSAAFVAVVLLGVLRRKRERRDRARD